MRVAFYLDASANPAQRELLAGAVSVARCYMPSASVMTIADDGAGFFALRRARAQAALAGETLFIDTDCELRADVSELWREKFDLALPAIDDPHVKYTGGVVFSREPAFWSDWVQRLDRLGETDVRTLLVEFGRHVDGCGLKVRRLDWRRYEYLPRDAADPADGAAIVHYRGPRKRWAGATS